MQHLRPYDYEKVKGDYLDSLEIIQPRNIDGRGRQYAFPIKHQVLRCGKWIPTEEVYYNALYLYYYLQQEWMFNACKDKGLLWHDAQHTTIEVDDYGRVRMYETPPSVEEVFEDYIARLTEVDQPTMDTQKIDVYYENEDGTKIYLGKDFMSRKELRQ